VVRNRYPLALIPPLAYLVGLIIIITVIIRHKVARSERRDSRHEHCQRESLAIDPVALSSAISAKLAPDLVKK